MQSKNFRYHLWAIGVILIWGTTLSSTKTLLLNGLNNNSIMFFRFLIAYLCLLALNHKQLFARSLRDELLLMAAGIFGGSLYFICEIAALQRANVADVSLLLSMSPIGTMILSWIFLKSKVTAKMVVGILIAMCGAVLVILNGSMSLEFNPLGYALALCGALSVSCYLTLVNRVEGYAPLFMTRKIFFYGLVTMLPTFFGTPLVCDIAILSQPKIIFNLLFLGMIASCFCYYSWNAIIPRLGAIKLGSYSYFQPVVAMITAALFLGEPISWAAIVGAALIIGGVWSIEKS
ncbi:MAG: DMT family transporter [Rikenellaceae bacterium]|nr:DMT family transporter [Rikenellaceae bacterium]